MEEFCKRCENKDTPSCKSCGLPPGWSYPNRFAEKLTLTEEI